MVHSKFFSPEITKFRIKVYKFSQKQNFGDIETDSNISLISPKTSVELSVVLVDFSERNASVAKTRNFEFELN
jgi:hypothetical protein